MDGWRAYIPLQLEPLQIPKRRSDRVIRQITLVLPQQAVACLGVLGLLDRVAQVGLLQRIEGDDDAVYLRERFVQIAFCGIVGELHFLRHGLSRLQC